MLRDDSFIRLALAEASRASEFGEVPVGCVVVEDGTVIGRGFNQPISRSDPTAHAEIVALRAAALRVGNYRLPGTTLYVTVEPCLMCFGAMVHARIDRLVYGARASERGGAEINKLDWSPFNHRFTIQGGVLEKECATQLRVFFEARRVSTGGAMSDGRL